MADEVKKVSVSALWRTAHDEDTTLGQRIDIGNAMFPGYQVPFLGDLLGANAGAVFKTFLGQQIARAFPDIAEAKTENEALQKLGPEIDVPVIEDMQNDPMKWAKMVVLPEPEVTA